MYTPRTIFNLLINSHNIHYLHGFIVIFVFIFFFLERFFLFYKFRLVMYVIMYLEEVSIFGIISYL